MRKTKEISTSAFDINKQIRRKRSYTHSLIARKQSSADRSFAYEDKRNCSDTPLLFIFNFNQDRHSQFQFNFFLKKRTEECRQDETKKDNAFALQSCRSCGPHVPFILFQGISGSQPRLFTLINGGGNAPMSSVLVFAPSASDEASRRVAFSHINLRKVEKKKMPFANGEWQKTERKMVISYR